MLKIFIVSLASILSTAGTLFGNGGGYHYGVDFTGSVAPFTAEGTENVQILDEKLDIILEDQSAKVSVIYQMQNITNKKVTVKFGFPVEDVVDTWADFLQEKRTPIIKPAYTKNYLVKINGKTLKHAYVAEPFGSDQTNGIKPFPGSEILKGIKGWQVSKMSLKKGETINLQITYDSQYDVSARYISDDSSTGPWQFKYRLSTGAVWNGPIKKGKITISHTNALDYNYVRVDKPANRFKKIGDKLVWEFENLEPTLADDISVQAKPGVGRYFYGGNDQTILSYYTLNQKWFIQHVDFTAQASSTLPDENQHHYGVNNLKSPWGEVWSEGVQGSGIGESITLTLNQPSKTAGFLLTNGYAYQDGLFTKNNRMKTMEVLINGTEKQLVEFADNSEVRRHFFHYNKPITTLKFTIKSVYKGTHYDDTCLTALSLLRRLEKEPKRYGVR